MFTNRKKISFHATGILVILLSLLLSMAAPGATLPARANTITIGYVHHNYGQAVKDEPTAVATQSKLWWNDGRWWGIMFDPTSTAFKIYWLDWGTQSWRMTSTLLDSRIDETKRVATRFDVFWDETSSKLYVASHIKLDNPSEVKQSENWARLYRYSYNTTSKTYAIDSNFPVTINKDKTKALVIEKDSAGRLWATYVSRVPSSDPNEQPVYHVYVNYTETAGNDREWSTPINLSTLNSQAATVKVDDIVSVIAYGDKVGLMWSNGLNGNFYFAEHPVSSSPTSDWNIQPINLGAAQIFANDHIKLVANGNGQVFSTVKSLRPLPNEAQLGIVARDKDGSFSFHAFSSAGSIDTRPSLLLDESKNELVMFATSNEAGGVICYKTMQITNPLANMQFAPGNCSSAGTGAPLFIASDQYKNIDNATTSKRNVNHETGIVALATDDRNGPVYLHNVLGSPRAIITDTYPAQGALVHPFQMSVTLTFSHDMKPATLTTSTFKVIGPAGEYPGNVNYYAGSRQAIFTATIPPISGQHRVVLGQGIQDTLGNAIYQAADGMEVLRFQVSVENVSVIFLPNISR